MARSPRSLSLVCGLLLVLLASSVEAQRHVLPSAGSAAGSGVSEWGAANCATAVTSPVAGSTECLDTTRGIWLNYDGTGWQSDAARAMKTVNVMDPRFGAVCDGSTNDSTAFQNAINSLGGTDVKIGAGLPAAEEGKGGIVVIPKGSCKIANVEVKNGTFLVGAGRLNTILIPAAASAYAVKVVGSHGGVRDLTIYNKNGLTGVTLLGIVPSDETQTTTVKEQNYNEIINLYLVGVGAAGETGMILRAGPDVGGVDSGAWYNYIAHVTINGARRGLWLREGQNAGASGANRNTFVGVRIGQAGTNIGLQIDDANTNNFVAMSFEGINTGTDPIATPTAIYIPTTTGPISGSTSNLNKFIGVEVEGNTRDVLLATAAEQYFEGAKTIGDAVDADPAGGTATYLTVTRQATSRVRVQSNTPATPVANTLYANTIPKVWGTFDGRVATFTVFACANCSVTRAAAGTYNVTITTAMIGANAYAVSAIADSTTMTLNAGASTAGSFQLVTTSGTDSARVQFMVIGQQ